MNYLSFYTETRLSLRQVEVIGLIADGLSSAEIGEKLCMSKRTAEGIRAELLIKTGANNSAALVAFAFRNGIIK